MCGGQCGLSDNYLKKAIHYLKNLKGGWMRAFYERKQVKQLRHLRTNSFPLRTINNIKKSCHTLDHPVLQPL
jgi:hypothetical protein